MSTVEEQSEDKAVEEASASEKEKESTGPEETMPVPGETLPSSREASSASETPDAEERDVEEDSDDGSMSLVKHLEELRMRLIRSLWAITAGSCVAYYFVEDIMHILASPVGKLYFMQPSEAFFTYLKVAVVAGFLLALPVVFYHVWRFFLPALTRKERAVLGIIVPVSVLLFFSGISFSFFLVLPAAIKFFVGFGGSDLEALFSIEKYFDFVIMFILPFGFVFELPLIITILGKLGILTSEFLKKYQRIVIFLSFVIGAFITPTPDIFTQSMIALPMIALYEVGYWIVKYILKK